MRQKRFPGLTFAALAILVCTCACEPDPHVPPTPLPPADVTVLLPGLDGNYNVGDALPDSSPAERTMILRLPGDIGSFRAVRFVVPGSWTGGQYGVWREIGGIAFIDTYGYYIDPRLSLAVAEFPDCELVARLYVSGGEFTWSCADSRFGTEVLLGREIIARFQCNAGAPPDTSFFADAFGTATGVGLIMEDAVRTP